MPANHIGSVGFSEPAPPAPRLSRICSLAEELHSVISSVESQVDRICGGSPEAQNAGPVPVPNGLNAQIEQLLERVMRRMRVVDAALIAEA
ncbi:MAG TPA: hypothetical protein VNU19_24215 [Candidatus Acidoferrum sp.]|jgi:hypothetical protein|nr:hypothetical protein [Candidatus Acidoferrum sp.]